jgi:hypothetical protein
VEQEGQAAAAAERCHATILTQTGTIGRHRPLSRHPGVAYRRNRRTGAPHAQPPLSALGTSADAGRLRHQPLLLPPLRPQSRPRSPAGAGAGGRAGAAAVGWAAPDGSPHAGGRDAGLPAQPTVCGPGDARAGATSPRPLTSAPSRDKRRCRRRLEPVMNFLEGLGERFPMQQRRSDTFSSIFTNTTRGRAGAHPERLAYVPQIGSLTAERSARTVKVHNRL